MAIRTHGFGGRGRTDPGHRVRGSHPPSPRAAGSRLALPPPAGSVPALSGSSPTTRASRRCSWAPRCCSLVELAFPGPAGRCLASPRDPSPRASSHCSPGSLGTLRRAQHRRDRRTCFSPQPDAWPLATADHRPRLYSSSCCPACCSWPMANALIQPSLFASADAAPQAQLASGSAAPSMGRQLGSAVGVAVLVAVLGRPPGRRPDGFDRAWICCSGHGRHDRGRRTRCLSCRMDRVTLTRVR